MPSLSPELANACLLIVDDNPTNLSVLVEYLKEYGFKLLIARDGESALTRARNVSPDLILLDVMMPVLDGFEVCKRLKADPVTQDIPIIFMTALASTEDKVRGFEVGAIDYVTKPMQQAEVLARVTTHLRLRFLTRQLQQLNADLEQRVADRTHELQRAYAKLEQLDKHKGDFIRVAAHELRTPLNAIEGYAQLLHAEAATDDDREMTDGLLTGARQLHTVIAAMLDSAELDAELVTVKAQETALAYIFTSLRERLRPALQARRMTLSMALDDLPMLQADATLLAKAFYQLLSNALKFTPDGKSISVTGHTTPPTDTQPAGVEVIVKDTGIGIDAQHHELVFEKFFQTGDVRFHSSGETQFKAGGPGLGLAIAKGIVLAHRGRIWAESPGYDEAVCPGSAFHVWLPLTV